MTVNHYAAMFNSIEALSCLPLINTLVKVGGVLVSPLYLAVEYNNIEYIEALVQVYEEECGAQWLEDIVNEYDEQALNLAIRKGHNDIAKLLIDSGFPIRNAVKTAEECNGDILLHILKKLVNKSPEFNVIPVGEARKLY